MTNEAAAARATAEASGLSARPFAYDVGGQLAVDGVSLHGLAEQFGTPLYVYSAEQIRRRLELFSRAFARVSHTVCYAVKANSSLAILQMLGQRGAGFDIVSGGGLSSEKRGYTSTTTTGHANPTAAIVAPHTGTATGGQTVTARTPAEVLVWEMHTGMHA